MLRVEAGVEFSDGLAEILELRLQARDLRPTLLRMQLLLHALGFLGQPRGRRVCPPPCLLGCVEEASLPSPLQRGST